VKNLKEMTVEQLLIERDRIEKSCAHWEDSQDGSHGAALYAAGYNDVYKELRLRGVL